MTPQQISAKDAWDRLGEQGAAVLVDVRTAMEWQNIGIPDLTKLAKETICIQWVTNERQYNPNFVEHLTKAVAVDKTIFMICRSGMRSQEAAQAAMLAGYEETFNVYDGFEGWRHSGLPHFYRSSNKH